MTCRWLIATLVPTLALAAPVVHSGRVFDAGGSPMNGLEEVDFELLNDLDQVRWTESHDVPFEDGYYAVQLGTQTPLSPALLVEDLDLRLSIGSVVVGRQALSAVPHALSVDGLVRVSAAPTACAGLAGTLRWASGQLEVCDGTDWRIVSTVATVLTGTGGSVTTDGNDTIHTFTTSGSFVVGAVPGTVQVEVLGGGGGGGTASANWASGGGGGGYIRGTVALSAGQTVTVTVGDKGLGRTLCDNGYVGTAGGTSSFGTYFTATGGNPGGVAGYVGTGGTPSSGAGVTVLASANGEAGNAATNNGAGGTNGGGATFGTGAPAVPNGTTGAHATGYGNGGSGGHSCQVGPTGGNGSPGVVIVRYPSG